MKQITLVPILTAALLVACNGQDGGNEAAEVNNLLEPVENAVLNAVGNAAEAQENVTADGAVAPPPPPANAAPQSEAPATRQPPVRPPEPKPEPDPHAGHDMGNMANMQH